MTKDNDSTEKSPASNTPLEFKLTGMHCQENKCRAMAEEDIVSGKWKVEEDGRHNRNSVFFRIAGGQAPPLPSLFRGMLLREDWQEPFFP